MQINNIQNFKADIIADSINPFGKRITSYLLKYPRFVHSEIMTHRALSRNAASSRAIPVEKMIEQVQTNPAGPIRWGKKGKGMQDHGELDKSEAENAQQVWIDAAQSAVREAEKLFNLGLAKQIVNRVLEPFVWMTTLVTATEWENFFALRVHKDAQPEFQYLAYMMLKAFLSHTPQQKNWLEWHLPFGENMPDKLDETTKLKVATARAARTSYLTMDGVIDVEKDIILHDRLAESGHWSPFEHSAQASNNNIDFFSGNFSGGWRQYRQNFLTQNRSINLHQLLTSYKESLNIKG